MASVKMPNIISKVLFVPLITCNESTGARNIHNKDLPSLHTYFWTSLHLLCLCLKSAIPIPSSLQHFHFHFHLNNAKSLVVLHDWEFSLVL